MENTKLIFGISFTVVLCLSYLAIASYMNSPEGLQYPNPGHYPGEIGPGTFNCSSTDLALGKCFWKFVDIIVTGTADISKWAHSNKVTNLNADKIDGYDASDLLAGGGGGFDTSDFSLIGTATFEPQETGTKTIGTFTKTELVCSFSNSANSTIVITASPPTSNPTNYGASAAGGRAKVFLVKIVNPTGQDPVKIYYFHKSWCYFSTTTSADWTYSLYLKGDGTLSINKYCPMSPNEDGYTHFTCYER